MFAKPLDAQTRERFRPPCGSSQTKRVWPLPDDMCVRDMSSEPSRTATDSSRFIRPSWHGALHADRPGAVTAELGRVHGPAAWTCAALSLAVAAACGPVAPPEPTADRAGWPDSIRLGLLPVESDVRQQWRPVAEHLEAELGVEVELFVGADYAATIDAAVSGDLEIVWLSPKPYVTARGRGADIEPVARWINAVTGIAGYRSLLIARSDSGISTIEDARGRTFAFNDPDSTSGFLVPSVLFLERGIDPTTYFSEVSFSGSHEATALAVADGSVDLASNNNETLPRLIDSGRIARDDIRIVWESEFIPTDPISVRGDLPQSLRDAVRDAVLGFDDPRALAELRVLGWIPARDADYDVIRTLEANRERLAGED